MWGLKKVRVRRSDALTQVGWQDLESLLASHYRSQGYQVDHCGTGRTGSRFDGGIDLKLTRGDEYVVVQVKHWNAYKVPHNDVHQLLGVMVNEGATGAVLITSGEFTQAAIDAANRQGHVKLVDGNELRTMLGASAIAAINTTPDRADEFVRAMNAPLLEREPTRVRSYGRPKPSAHLGWLIVAGFGLIVFVLLVHGVMEKTKWTASPAAHATPANMSRQHSDFAPVRSSALLRPTVDDPCKEAVDHDSGEYLDHCVSDEPRAPPTKAELREQKRRADEAITVIEASTPEM